MKITKHDDGDGAFAWTNSTNNGFINFQPACGGSMRMWWCEDDDGHLYSFTGLVNGSTDAPAYMRRMAKQAKKDLGLD